MNTAPGRRVAPAMPMTILFLDPTHELVASTPDAESAAFAHDPRHPGETPQVLLLLDDHASPSQRTEVLPADPEIQEWIPQVAKQIRESSLLDAFGAVRDVLVARGIPELTADAVIEAAGPLARQLKVPENWTIWGAVPRGSLSSLGDGRWMLIWPDLDERGRDMALFAAEGDATDERVHGPERTYRLDRAIAPFVRVARTGLTMAQIEAFLLADHPPKFDPEAAFESMFPTSEAA